MNLTMMLILKILLLSQLCAAFDWVYDYGVNLTPNNPKVCIGDNMTMTCTTTEMAEFDSSEMTFKVWNRTNVEHSEIQIIDEESATMTLWNFLSSNYPKVCCKQKSEKEEGECQLVQVYDNPVPVKNFSCFVNDWAQDMNCTWSPGVDKGIKPKVEFDWRIWAANCEWTSCPDLNKDFHYCYWRNTSMGDFSMKDVNIRINVTAMCGKTVITHYTLDTRTIVKPAAATDLRSKVLNSTCVQVSWTATRLEYRKIYKVWYSSKWNDTKTIILDAENTGTIADNSVIFCELVPATAYEFHVLVKPGDIFWSRNSRCMDCSRCDNTADIECECLEINGYWSDQRTTEATTLGDLPAGSPAVSPGGYRWDPNECDQPEKMREVSIYWKPLKEIIQNGDILGYEVKFKGGKNSVSKDPAGDTTSLTERIKCEEEFNVTIQARNKNGPSPHVSTFVILDLRKGVHPPHFLVEMSNTTDTTQQRTVHVAWRYAQLGPNAEAAGITDITGYTVYWCEKEQGECARGTIPHWLSVEAHVNSTELQLQFPENYLYSVAVDTNRGSSGMTWQSCIYTKDVVPSRSPGKVEVHAGIEDRALYVTWERLTCESGKPFIDQYIIEYCHENYCQKQSTKDNSIFLRDLEADVKYRVRVQGMTMTKDVGPWSDSVTATALDDSWETWHIIVAVFGGLFILALCLAGTLCILRKCSKWKKKTFSPRPISTIEIDAHGFENKQFKNDEKFPPTPEPQIDSYGYVRQTSVTSTESGYEEGTPGSPESSPDNRHVTQQDTIEEVSEEIEKEKEKQAQLLQQQLWKDNYVKATNVDLEIWQNELRRVGIQPPEPVRECQIGMALHPVPNMGMGREEMEVRRSLLEQEHVLRNANTSSESASQYVVATVGSSTGASSHAGINGSDGSTRQRGNAETSFSSFNNLAFNKDDASAREVTPTNVATSGSSYVLATNNPDAGARLGEQNNYVGHENVAYRSEGTVSSDPISDYHTLAIASSKNSNAIFPGPYSHEPTASGDKTVDLSELEFDEYDGNTSSDKIILDLKSLQKTVGTQGVNTGEESDDEIIETPKSTDEESNSETGHSRRSSDDNAYVTVIPGNEAGPKDSGKSEDGHNADKEETPRFDIDYDLDNEPFENEVSVQGCDPSSVLTELGIQALTDDASDNVTEKNSAPPDGYISQQAASVMQPCDGYTAHEAAEKMQPPDKYTVLEAAVKMQPADGYTAHEAAAMMQPANGYSAHEAAEKMQPADVYTAHEESANGYNGHDASDMMQPANGFTTHEIAESLKGNTEMPSQVMASVNNGYVSEILAQVRSPTVSESRSSINDVEMVDLLEHNNTPSDFENARSVENGHVSDSSANGTNKRLKDLQGKEVTNPGYVTPNFANSVARVPEEEESFEPSNDDTSSTASSQSSNHPKNDNKDQAQFSTGYVSQVYANKPPNDNHNGVATVKENKGSFAAHVGYVPQEVLTDKHNIGRAANDGYVSEEVAAAATGAIIHKAVEPYSVKEDSVDQDNVTKDTNNGDDVQSDILSSVSSSEDRDTSPDIVKADENGNITDQGLDFTVNSNYEDEDSTPVFDDKYDVLAEMNQFRVSTNTTQTLDSGDNGYITTQDVEKLGNGGIKTMTSEAPIVDTELIEAGTPLSNTGTPKSGLSKPNTNGYVKHEFIENQRLS